MSSRAIDVHHASRVDRSLRQRISPRLMLLFLGSRDIPADACPGIDRRVQSLDL
ncbi:MAG TPA: hypothetical protein PLS46_04370 [Microthrixaceae bacterium]|nr:hypothetical protein [Microthrixaceae bacterium]